MRLLHRFVLLVERHLMPSRSRAREHRRWEARWRNKDFSAAWCGRGVAPEILDACDRGWLPSRGAVLDIGCGLGEIAAWFAARGHPAIGVDIAESAVRRAIAAHAHLASPPEFLALDICAAAPPDRCFEILVDRGCLHQIKPHQRRRYARHLGSVASPSSRMLLFVRAFRHGHPAGDPREWRHQINWVTRTFQGIFHIEKVTFAFLDAQLGAAPENALPGLVFWLTRQPVAAAQRAPLRESKIA